MGPAQREKIAAAKAEAVRKEEEEKVRDHVMNYGIVLYIRHNYGIVYCKAVIV